MRVEGGIAYKSVKGGGRKVLFVLNPSIQREKTKEGRENYKNTKMEHRDRIHPTS
jgi:hypothetical protein